MSARDTDRNAVRERPDHLTTAPAVTRPARLSPLAVLPVFLDLRGKRVLVAGPDAEHAELDGLVWKVELLAAAGACVEVYCPHPSDDLVALQAAPPAGCVLLIQRGWQPADFRGAAVAIGALDGDAAADFAAAAKAAGVPVNVVDTPALGTFNFGTIVNRAPLTIGISTEGAAPVVGQAIRAKIEALIHPAIGTWLEAAKGLRDAVKARFPMGAERRALWRRFADRALTATASPDQHDLDAMLDDIANTGRGANTPRGSVVLVGAGPGDPDLITVKALRALQSADVIMYDRLVGDGILELGRREARRVLVGKTGGGRSCRQSDINRVMVDLALEGKRVIRLKGGDPLVFGRANEEIDACRVAGIPVEIVPGISAAMGAAADLGVSLTDRTAARRLQFITGHSESGHAPDHDWPRLADPWTTTVFYMGGRTFAEMLPKLLVAGLDPATPAVAVAAATRPEARHVACRVDEIPHALATLDTGQPCLIMVGRAMGSLAVGRAGSGGRELRSANATEEPATT
jgi:uroporphyrin-III C-methyltransferase/precorrin-2 dehydrogenase/sirohydrochlorin ferrochelatase